MCLARFCSLCSACLPSLRSSTRAISTLSANAACLPFGSICAPASMRRAASASSLASRRRRPSPIPGLSMRIPCAPLSRARQACPREGCCPWGIRAPSNTRTSRLTFKAWNARALGRSQHRQNGVRLPVRLRRRYRQPHCPLRRRLLSPSLLRSCQLPFLLGTRRRPSTDSCELSSFAAGLPCTITVSLSWYSESALCLRVVECTLYCRNPREPFRYFIGF